MPPFDPHRKPSASMVERAIEDYGEDPSDYRYQLFAFLVAEGKPLQDAYSVVSEETSESSARSRASILAAHPKIRRRIIQHGLPRRKLLEALVPEATDVMTELMRKGPATQRRQAADSVLDRGGAPRSSEIRQSLTADLQVSGRALLELAAEIDGPAPVEPAKGSDVLDADEVEDAEPDLELPEATAEELEPAPAREHDPEHDDTRAPATPTRWTRGAGAEESRGQG